MPHATLGPGEVQEILRLFSGSYDLDLPPGHVRLLGRSLPGKAVCAILPDIGDGVLRVVYDANKPNAFAHVQAMVREWWESYQEPIVLPNGVVAVVPRICPLAERETVHLAVAPREPVD